MARDDAARRRLRALYDRNKRRVSALADARDSRRGRADEVAAPRRFIVGAQRTRNAGFGRGGAQVRRVVRQDDRSRGVPRRFTDKNVFRRGNRDRFRRDDDIDRELRRERSRGGRRGGGAASNADRRDGSRRFGVSRRLRLRNRDRGERRLGEQNKGRVAENKNGRKNSNNKNNNNSNNGGGGRGNANKKNNNSQRRGGDKGRAREPPLTKEQLDAQLDSYRDNQ